MRIKGGGGGLKTLFLSNSLYFSKMCVGGGGGGGVKPPSPSPSVGPEDHTQFTRGLMKNKILQFRRIQQYHRKPILYVCLISFLWYHGVERNISKCMGWNQLWRYLGEYWNKLNFTCLICSWSLSWSLVAISSHFNRFYCSEGLDTSHKIQISCQGHTLRAGNSNVFWHQKYESFPWKWQGISNKWN